MRLTGSFVIVWLAVGAAFDAWMFLSGGTTVTDWFRTVAYRYPWTPGVVIGGLAFVVAHLFLEELFWRGR